MTSGPGNGAVNSNPNAPADPETLKRLKEELMQQKQQDSKSGAAAEKAKSKVIMREAAGKKWVDSSLQVCTSRSDVALIPLQQRQHQQDVQCMVHGPLGVVHRYTRQDACF